MSTYRYLALDAGGRRIRGSLEADTAVWAQEELSRRGLTPVRLERWRGMAAQAAPAPGPLNRRLLSSFLYDLGTLAEAGVDFRSALGVLAQSEDPRGATVRLARALEHEVAAGAPLEAAFSRVFGGSFPAVAGLVAGGQAAGSLPQALTRGAENLEQELEAADGVAAAISYPGFILVMTAISLLVILLVVVPSLAPLAQQSQNALPPALGVMFGLSKAIRSNASGLALIGTALAAAVLVGWRLGLVRRPIEAWLLDGPARSITRGLVFGGAAANLGALIAAKVPAGDAIQLAQRTCGWLIARERLGRSADLVREGASVSQALRACPGVPAAVTRMALIGEEAGRLGQMLDRAGGMERRRALRRIRRASQWLGPILIICLGAMVGLIMASLLASITTLADTATAS
jgi:type II secretory pathway component PulF